MQQHKDIHIGKETYRVGRFSARVGSFVFMQIMTKVAPAMLGGSASLRGIPLPSAGAAMSEREFYDIQNHCMEVCSIIGGETGAPSPIMMADGRLDQRLEFNFPVVMALTIHTLQFNFADFFSGGNPALASLTSLFPTASSSETTPPSTDTQ